MQQSLRSPASPLAELSPAYFGMAMATGIVSIGAWRLGLPLLGYILFGLNVGIYVLLWILYLLRLQRYPKRVITDLCDHRQGVGYFTVIAATGIVGIQSLLLGQSIVIASILWVAAIILWLGLTYSIFTVFIVKEDKPPLNEGINGGWLLAVVASQSVAALSALLAEQPGHDLQHVLNIFALATWLWGGMLYIWMISLIFYRYTFFKLPAGDLSPPYWINMGAMAISTLTGSLLLINSAEAPSLLSLQPFIKGFTILYWVTGSWWIPMLLLLGIWRHIYKRFPLQYDPHYWGMVFPLGMYATGTLEMAQAMSFDFLDQVPTLFFGFALLAWTIVFIGVIRTLFRSISTSPAKQS